MKLMFSDRGLVARAMRRTANDGYNPYDSHKQHAVSFATEKRNEWKRKRHDEVKFSKQMLKDYEARDARLREALDVGATAEVGWWKEGNK